MSLKGRPCFQRRKREVEKGAYIFLGFHQIGTADSLTEQLTDKLLEFNTQVGRKKSSRQHLVQDIPEATLCYRVWNQFKSFLLISVATYTNAF